MKHPFYHKTIFWNSVMDTFMTLSGMSAASLHSLHTDDVWVWLAGACGLIGMIMKAWIKDHNNNGILDIFE